MNGTTNKSRCFDAVNRTSVSGGKFDRIDNDNSNSNSNNSITNSRSETQAIGHRVDDGLFMSVIDIFNNADDSYNSIISDINSSHYDNRYNIITTDNRNNNTVVDNNEVNNGYISVMMGSVNDTLASQEIYYQTLGKVDETFHYYVLGVGGTSVNILGVIANVIIIIFLLQLRQR